MAGAGYLVVGLLSILPSLLLAAYVVQHPRFRKGMPRREWLLCWVCMLSAFFFPLTCGSVGSHKRRLTLYEEETGRRLQDAGGGAAAWDYGFWILQLHLLVLVVCFVAFQNCSAGSAGGTGQPRQAGAAGKRAADLGGVRQRARPAGS
mmetsp:Transcript_26540/g.84171  ORF Transcript_26540/g.84171 Transcript_26540/m.84171 type:complete len:148 (-) Transcript_26540:23-466(-)